MLALIALVAGLVNMHMRPEISQSPAISEPECGLVCFSKNIEVGYSAVDICCGITGFDQFQRLGELPPNALADGDVGIWPDGYAISIAHCFDSPVPRQRVTTEERFTNRTYVESWRLAAVGEGDGQDGCRVGDNIEATGCNPQVSPQSSPAQVLSYGNAAGSMVSGGPRIDGGGNGSQERQRTDSRSDPELQPSHVSAIRSRISSLPLGAKIGFSVIMALIASGVGGLAVARYMKWEISNRAVVLRILSAIGILWIGLAVASS